jgi:Flp pilus assembly protein TadG
MALILTLMCTMFAGVVDYSVAIQQTLRVQEAASAGAEYGVSPGNESNLSGMEAAAVAAGNGVPGFSAVATNLYTCIPGGGAVSSTTVCTAATYQDAGTPNKYVVVKTTATLPSIFAYPGMPKNLTVTGYSIMRVPWSK